MNNKTIYYLVIVTIVLMSMIQAVLVINSFFTQYIILSIISTFFIIYGIHIFFDYKDKLIEDKRLLDSIIENDNSGIGIIDTNGVFIFSSNILNNILEYEINEINGNNILDITIKTYKKDIKKALYYANTQGHYKRLKHECLKKDGTKIFVETSFTLLPNKEEIVIIMNNLQYEKELEILNISLENRVRLKTQELEALNAKLENTIKIEVEKNRDKDMLMYQQARLASMGEMIGNIAHQWRQPLTAIIALIQNIDIRSRLGKIDDDFIRDKTEQALQITKQMSHTIDDFRNFFSQTKKKDEFVISKLFQENINFLGDTLKANNIELKTNITSNSIILGYKNEISHAFINIINNAKDALIENNIGNVKRYIFVDIYDGEKEVIIKIKDNAGGIPNQYIEKIFDPYFTTKHQSHGTGIGLYMTKQIIEKNMLGTLSVKNIKYQYDDTEYAGAEFYISFNI